MLQRHVTVGLILTAMLAVGCGGDDSSDSDVEPAAEGGDDADASAASASDEPADDGGGAGPFGSGAASVTIGDRSWEFEGFECAFESSGVLNEGTTLGTNIIDEADGVRIQLQIDVYDDGAAQFTMDDIDDFENPAFSYLETSDIMVTVDGDTVRAEGDVTDEASGDFEVVPMTFEGECGPSSLR